MTMPSLMGVVHEACNSREPSISTVHILQAPVGFRRSSWQKVGILIPAISAAFKIDIPVGTSKFVPSIVIFTNFIPPIF